MSRNKVVVSSIFFIGLIFQSIVLFTDINEKLNEGTEVSTTNALADINKIRAIDMKLESLKNTEVIYCEKIQEKWSVRLEVKGRKEEVADVLTNIKEFNIEEYNILYENDDLVLTIKLISK